MKVVSEMWKGEKKRNYYPSLKEYCGKVLQVFLLIQYDALYSLIR